MDQDKSSNTQPGTIRRELVSLLYVVNGDLIIPNIPTMSYLKILEYE